MGHCKMIGMIGQQTAERMGASMAVDALEMARPPTTPAGLALGSGLEDTRESAPREWLGRDVRQRRHDRPCTTSRRGRG